jgi:hypothetical protein
MAGRTPALGKYLTLTGIGCEHAIRQAGSENQKKRCGYAQYGHGFFLFFFLKRNIDPHQRRFKRLLFQSKLQELDGSYHGRHRIHSALADLPVLRYRVETTRMVGKGQ